MEAEQFFPLLEQQNKHFLMASWLCTKIFRQNLMVKTKTNKAGCLHTIILVC